MINETIYTTDDNGRVELKRVTKPTAKKHSRVYVATSKVALHRYNNAGYMALYDAEKSDMNFDTWCNHFSYYNCNNEMGKRLKYFVEVK